MTLTFTDCRYAYRRNRRPVLDGFSYRLPAGVTVLLGPNGAGKSTLLKLAASVQAPQAGRVALGGTDSRERAYRKLVSWMPQHITAMASLTVREQVAYTGWLKGMNRADAWRQALRALDLVQLRDLAGTRATRVSGGQLRRVGVASALVHDARVLLLDEPTAGMDPTQRRVFRDLLGEAAASGGISVLMSTHDVADLVDDADHVAVLNDGTIRYEGSTHGFLAEAPADAPGGRRAEAAYTALTRG